MKKLLIFGILVVFVAVVVAALPSREDTQICNEDCKLEYNEAVSECGNLQTDCLENCEGKHCRNTCFKEKKVCLKEAREKRQLCTLTCKRGFSGCEDGAYEFKETFTEGCDVCECNVNGRVTCKREPYCNKNVSISAESCEANGGFYYPICKGPYFSVVCSQQNLCLCGGNAEWTCGEGQECFYDFVSPLKKKGSIKGFRDLLGRPLGDVGVCAVNN